ncbi:MAG: hypothetical protein IJ489_10525 [Clostridia bacterium]|nr:hypothetical protein [Clostridia bacterium]
MKKHTGEASRMTLSYDMTFFALVRIALEGTDFNIRKRRCIAHPVRRRPMMDDNAALAYTAYVSALLTYYKLEDTIADDKGIKRLGAQMAKPWVKGMKRRAEKTDGDPASIVRNALHSLSELEKSNCAVPDMPADIFGDMLGKLLALGLDATKSRIAYEIGLHTGRWVYLTDAVFDYDDDEKSGSYNPFRFTFASAEEMYTFRETSLKGIMTMEADAIMRAVAFLDFEGRAALKSCIENIIYDGMESALSVAYGKERTDGK